MSSVSALRAGPLVLTAPGCENVVLQAGLLAALRPSGLLQYVADEGGNRLSVMEWCVTLG